MLGCVSARNELSEAALPSTRFGAGGRGGPNPSIDIHERNARIGSLLQPALSEDGENGLRVCQFSATAGGQVGFPDDYLAQIRNIAREG